MPSYTKRKPLSWFEKQVGKDIVKNNTTNLFEPPIKVEDKRHAKALHATQDKGNRYSF